MKFLKLLFLLCLLGAVKVSTGQDQADLDVNNVRARFSSMGSLFWDLNSVARYEVPKIAGSQGIRKSPIFMETLWFHAIDSSGDTLIAVDMYHQGGSDFGQGALPPNSAIGFQEQVAGVIYKVSRDEIEAGRDNPALLTNDILNWPAFYYWNGKKIPLAPFVDVDKDGEYDPQKGDYPFISGDQSLFFVYHDMVNHEKGKTKPLGLQIQVEGFAYATNDKFNNYVFVRYKIISQNQNLSQFRVGVLSDYDLGNYTDDYVGTDTSRNMTYVVNGDGDDEGLLGYGLNPPAFATVFLNQPLCGSCMNENTFSGEFRIPQNQSEYSHLLYGLNTNGDSVTVNAPGMPTGLNSTYHFTGNPVNGTGWNMANDNRFTAKDYRMLGITGQDSLLQGDTFNLNLLFVYARATSGGELGSLSQLQTDVDDIFTRYYSKPQIPLNCFAPQVKEDTSGNGVGFNMPTQKQSLAHIYPNPATKTLQVHLNDVGTLVNFQLLNANGQIIKTGTTADDFSLDVNLLPNGLYFLKLNNPSQHRQETFKFIIQH